MRLCLTQCDYVFIDALLGALDLHVLEDYRWWQLFQWCARVGDVRKLRVFIDHVHPSDSKNVMWPMDSIWSEVWNNDCADLLLEKDYLYVDAIHHCQFPRTISHLLTKTEYATCPQVLDIDLPILTNVELVRVFHELWNPVKNDEILEYVNWLIRECFFHGDVRVLKELLRSACSTFPDDHGRSVVQYALNNVFLNSLRRRSLLLECVNLGANVDVVDADDGSTILIQAVWKRCQWCVDLMLNVGSNARIRDAKGYTALDYVGDDATWLQSWTLKKLKLASM